MFKPSKIIAIGLNYHDHAAEMKMRKFDAGGSELVGELAGLAAGRLAGIPGEMIFQVATDFRILEAARRIGGKSIGRAGRL